MQHKNPSPGTQLPLAIGWRAAADFDQFVSGPNGLAVKSVRELANGQGHGCVYLYGQPGSGRSHLLRAACRTMGMRGQTAAYLPLGAPAELSPALLKGLEDVGLVALDDLDGIAGDADWEESLFHLYNRLLECRGRILVAASRRPCDLAMQLPDLVSRLSAGLVQRLLPLSDDQLLEALQRRAMSRGLDLPADTGRYLFGRLPRDAGTLFALLDVLDEKALAEQRRLTVPFVREVLSQTPWTRHQGG